jgi:hypothetical protein
MQSKLQNLQPPIQRREKNATAATCPTFPVFRPGENGTHHYGLSAGRINTGLLRNMRKTDRGVVQCEAAKVGSSLIWWWRGTAPFVPLGNMESCVLKDTRQYVKKLTKEFMVLSVTRNFVRIATLQLKRHAWV